MLIHPYVGLQCSQCVVTTLAKQAPKVPGPSSRWENTVL